LHLNRKPKACRVSEREGQEENKASKAIKAWPSSIPFVFAFCFLLFAFAFLLLAFSKSKMASISITVIPYFKQNKSKQTTAIPSACFDKFFVLLCRVVQIHFALVIAIHLYTHSHSQSHSLTHTPSS
jgi:hypothetical protein